MSKHTPGPWYRNVSARYPIYAERTPGKKDWVHIGNANTATPTSGLLPGEEEANLNLMTAAPELLAACHSALLCIHAGRGVVDTALREEAESKLRAVLQQLGEI